MIELVDVQYYGRVFYGTMFAICMMTSLFYTESNSQKKLLKNYSIILPLLLSTLLIIFLGLRPCSWAFGDMMMYNHRWNVIEASSNGINFDFNREWFFSYVLDVCKTFFTNSQFWFLVVEIFYIGCQFWACKRLLWENVWMAVLFVFFSYQFFTYGVNGIRNGMGTGIMMLSISFFCNRNAVGYIVGFLLFLLAIGCHRSIMIPMAALMVSLFVIKDIKKAVSIWLVCIFLSFFFGQTFVNFFSNLGFDDRMSSYANDGASEKVMSGFSHSGFRWDFLLYSAMPVWLAWYVEYKGIKDKTFTLLANTYIIANSFWILVCRVSFSNRFAYLSWFMYALVIAYAVIRVPLWKDQDRKAGRILMAHSAFTMIMWVLGK